MAQYKKGLKSKVLNALVIVEDPKDMRNLINKVIKINNRIYQKEWANKGHNKHMPVHRAPQQILRQWYRGPEPINLSGTKKTQKGNSRNRL